MARSYQYRRDWLRSRSKIRKRSILDVETRVEREQVNLKEAPFQEFQKLGCVPPMESARRRVDCPCLGMEDRSKLGRLVAASWVEDRKEPDGRRSS